MRHAQKVCALTKVDTVLRSWISYGVELVGRRSVQVHALCVAVKHLIRMNFSCPV